MVETRLHPVWPELVKWSCPIHFILPTSIYIPYPSYQGISTILQWNNGTMHMKKVCKILNKCEGFPRGSVVKKLPVNAGDMCSILGWGRSPAEGNGYLFQYSCLENPTDRGAWWATVHGVAKSQT